MTDKEEVFEAPANWKQELEARRRQRREMGDNRYINDSQYEDRPTTREELIAFAEAVMNNKEVYAGFLRVGEKGNFTDEEGGLITSFEEYYCMKNADKLPRHTPGFSSMYGTVRKFASGRYKSWDDPVLSDFLKIVLSGSERSREAAGRSFNEFLRRAQDKLGNSDV